MNEFNPNSSVFYSTWNEFPECTNHPFEKVFTNLLSTNTTDTSNSPTESWKKICLFKERGYDDTKVSECLNFLFQIASSTSSFSFPPEGICDSYLKFLEDHFNLLIIFFYKAFVTEKICLTPSRKKILLKILIELFSLEHFLQVWKQGLNELERERFEAVESKAKCMPPEDGLDTDRYFYDRSKERNDVRSSVDEDMLLDKEDPFFTDFLIDWEKGRAVHEFYLDKETSQKRWKKRTINDLCNIVSTAHLLHVDKKKDLLGTIIRRIEMLDIKNTTSQRRSKRLMLFGIYYLLASLNDSIELCQTVGFPKRCFKFLKITKPVMESDFKSDPSLKPVKELFEQITTKLTTQNIPSDLIKKTSLKKHSTDPGLKISVKPTSAIPLIASTSEDSFLPASKVGVHVNPLNKQVEKTINRYFTTIHEIIAHSKLQVLALEEVTGKGESIQKHKETVNRVSNFIARYILSSDSRMVLKIKIGLFTEVAKKLKEKRNFEAFNAVYSGMNLLAVQRLSRLFLAMNENYYLTFGRRAGAIVSKDFGSKENPYLEQGFLPASGRTRFDLARVFEGNSKYHSDSFVNMDQLQIIGGIFCPIFRAQQKWKKNEESLYLAGFDPYLKNRILRTESEMEEKLMNLSYRIRPEKDLNDPKRNMLFFEEELVLTEQAQKIYDEENR